MTPPWSPIPQPMCMRSPGLRMESSYSPPRIPMGSHSPRCGVMTSPTRGSLPWWFRSEERYEAPSWSTPRLPTPTSTQPRRSLGVSSSHNATQQKVRHLHLRLVTESHHRLLSASVRQLHLSGPIEGSSSPKITDPMSERTRTPSVDAIDQRWAKRRSTPIHSPAAHKARTNT